MTQEIRVQYIYMHIYDDICLYKGSMNPTTCFLEENVDEISVIVILSHGWYPYSYLGRATMPINPRKISTH